PSVAGYEHDQMPGDDRIRARIADVIKSRVRPVAPMAAAQHAPLTRGRGRGPDPLLLNSAPRGEMRAEPPLTAAHRAAAAAPAPAPAPAMAHPAHDDAYAYDMAQTEDALFDD